MKNEQNGVWARRSRPKINISKADANEVESLLSTKFVGGFPVIFSSARGGIKLIVQEFWPEKEISIFPYASQCVVNAIQAASVVPFTRIDLYSDIIYNQWGMLDRTSEKVPFIEDSCDTLLREGSSVLRLGGKFELWSLPKILNTRFGAVIWCQKEADANHLREVRDNTSKHRIWQKKVYRNLRFINTQAYRKWENSEFQTYQLTRSELGMIKKEIQKWKGNFNERIELGIAARKKLIQKFYDFPEVWANLELLSDEVSAPVVVLINSPVPANSIWADRNFERMHRFSSGNKPEIKTIYKFLQDKGLK